MRNLLLRRHQAIIRFQHRSAGVIRWCELTVSTITAIASLLCLICLIIHIGYDHSAYEYRIIKQLLVYCQSIFLINILLGYFIHFRKTLKQSLPIKWLADAAVVLTIIPCFFTTQPDSIFAILYSNKFLYLVIGIYAVITLSQSIFRLVGKRTNPSLLLSCSFVIFIIIGTFLLMLPRCTVSGINFTDSLFVSTSAVCITGLTPIDIPTTFTPMGLLILALLMQIGALGVITFTSFFALFFSGNKSIYNQLMLKDIIYSQSMSALIPTLFYILIFTIIIEVGGALLIWLTVHGTLNMSLSEEMIFAGFHAISAFCNAGFSCYPDGFANTTLLYGNISIYWVMTLLIISGSIGFPILVNVKDAIGEYLSRFWYFLRRQPSKEIRRVHIYNMNTKIVIYTFVLLFVAGAVSFFFLEYNNTLAGMTLWEKITQSVFNSATPRSAGFISVSPDNFLNSTLLIMLFLMWVGGSSQSTAGGIKVNTLATIWLNVRSLLRGQTNPTAFKRTVSPGSLHRAYAVVAVSIFSYLLFSVLLLMLEPDLPPKALLYESMSALFTVGSSLGVTPSLSESSEILLCIAMFVGRVGIISLLMGIVKKKPQHGYTLPSDNIIIN